METTFADAIKLKHMLEKELYKQETMQERAVIRKELREVYNQIKSLKEEGYKEDEHYGN
jgi:hypothetical protein